MDMHSQRNHTIDVLKGLAIIMVVFTHFNWTDEQRKWFIFPYFIDMAIPVFMIITGYVYSLSFSQNGITSIEEAYRWKGLFKRIIRYTIPIAVVIIWELLDPNVGLSPSNGLDVLRWITKGTSGSGSYYYPIMMQLVFVFPLVYFIVKNKDKGLLICFGITAVCEFLAWAYEMNAICYRVLMFRYIFLISIGCFAFMKKKISLRIAIAMTIVGIFYITAIRYFGYEAKVVNKDWASRNFISSMMIAPVMIWILQNVKIRVVPLEVIGKASYHIFLVQMIYYLAYFKKVGSIVSSSYLHLVLGIVICLIAGVLFYYIDLPIQKWITKILSKRQTKKLIEENDERKVENLPPVEHPVRSSLSRGSGGC